MSEEARREIVHEAKYDTAFWNTGNGRLPVLIIAYSEGAMHAFCIIRGWELGALGRPLTAGNYSAVWLPCSQLSEILQGGLA